MFPKVVLHHQYMPPRSLDVPAGLSDDEVVRRTIDAVERRCVVGYVVWDATRMTRLTPSGARSEDTATSVILNALPLNQPLAPVLQPGDPGHTLPPLHQQARKWLIGRWGICYPDHVGGWTPLGDSTLDLLADGSFTWRSPLPWFTDGKGWSVSESGQTLALHLATRYHWSEWHQLVRLDVPERRAWLWRADDQRDVMLAIAID